MKNSIMISVDDLFNHVKYRDKFGVTIQTPNLDRLAEMGNFLEAAYATTPLCNPSRATILTGQSIFETQIFSNVEDFHKEISPSETVFAAFKRAGYLTAVDGKVFHSNKIVPEFADGIIDIVMQPTGQKENTFGYKFGAGPAPSGLTDADFWDYDVATKAAAFLTNAQNATQPFFLSVGFSRPHYPTIAPERYFDLYPLSEIAVPGLSAQDGDLSDFARQFLIDNDPPASTKARVQAYLASVTFMDAQLGRVLDAMDAGGHWDDTSVVLFSDHGFLLGDRDMWGKFTLWEETTNAPMIVYDPDQAVTGQTISTPVSFNQIFPTLTDLAGIATPRSVSAHSFAGLIDPDLGAYQEAPVMSWINGSLSMRSGDYRLIRYEDGSLELYDLVVDPAQAVNLAEDPASRALLEDSLMTLRKAAQAEKIRLVGEIDEIGFNRADDKIIAAGGVGTLRGESGDDTYFIAPGTHVDEDRQSGLDTVILRSDFSRDAWQYYIPAHVENFTAGIGIVEITIIGNNRDNRIAANGKRDSVVTVSGLGGDDTVFGAIGDDRIAGNGGDDVLQGWRGDDHLMGGFGDDFLGGFQGDDRLVPGRGEDTAMGFSGADVFVFRPDEGRTQIARVDFTDPSRILARDFDSKEDLIELVGFGFGSKAAALSAFSQTRDGAMFSAEGTSILLHDVSVSQISRSNIRLVYPPSQAAPLLDDAPDPLLL